MVSLFGCKWAVAVGLMATALFSRGAENGPPPYHFGGGERIKIVVPGVDSLEQVVSEDGYIALPLGGVINIRGKTIPEAQAAALQGLAANSDNRKLSVALAILERPNRFVSISGEVKKPQMLPIIPGAPLPLISVLASAEGGTIEADLSRVKVIRTAADGTRKTIFYDASKLTMAGDGNETSDIGPDIQPGDVVVVPRGEVYILAGDVAKPGVFSRRDFMLNPGEPARVSRVLFAGGGLRISANRRELKVIRTRPDGSKEVIPVVLADALKAPGAVQQGAEASNVSDPILHDGDMLYASATGGVAIYGKVRLAGVYPIGGEHMKLTRLIALAGGFLDHAKTSSVTVVHASNPTRPQRVDVSSVTKEGNVEQDLELDDGDLVFVSERLL